MVSHCQTCGLARKHHDGATLLGICYDVYVFLQIEEI